MADEVHEVIQAVRRPVNVEVDGKKMPFGKDYAFRVKDAGVADEIRAKYGSDVTVTKIKMPHIADRGHKYFFAIPDLPWHREEGQDAVPESRKNGPSEKKRPVGDAKKTSHNKAGDKTPSGAKHKRKTR